ncbi:hypothetical protein BJV77DRAFT_1024929, partial [Russula vinacea]
LSRGIAVKAVHRRPVGISGLVVDIVHATGLWNEESTLVKANEQDCMFLGYFAPKSTCSLHSPIHKATIDSSPGKTKFIIVKIYPDYPTLYFPRRGVDISWLHGTIRTRTHEAYYPIFGYFAPCFTTVDPPCLQSNPFVVAVHHTHRCPRILNVSPSPIFTPEDTVEKNGERSGRGLSSRLRVYF